MSSDLTPAPVSARAEVASDTLVVEGAIGWPRPRHKENRADENEICPRTVEAPSFHGAIPPIRGNRDIVHLVLTGLGRRKKNSYELSGAS
jgi:hypothetical protein